MKDRCPANPERGVTAGRHRYTPNAALGGYTLDGAARKWQCDYCGKVIRFDDRYKVQPRAR